MGRAFALGAVIAALAGCGSARGDVSARGGLDGGSARGSDGGARAIEPATATTTTTAAATAATSIDQCRVDADCVATTRACCPTECVLYVDTRARAAEYRRACRDTSCPRNLVCREPPRRVVPACVGGGCVDRASRRRDRCDRDDECVQTMNDAACCHLCGARVVTRLQLLDEEKRCAAARTRPACFEGDCHAASVAPACVRHRCAVKPPR
ncbi:MAG TPA: hypothetical protein VFF06_00890 [Polyangia bacterium]|nr:hypothetical protein [Polyangia bacterium]